MSFKYLGDQNTDYKRRKICNPRMIQWGSEYQTCQVFKCSKVVQSTNGPLLECHFNTGLYFVWFSDHHMNNGPVFKWWSEYCTTI